MHRVIIRRMNNTSPPTEQSVNNHDDIVIFRRNHYYSILVVFALFVGILLGYVIWGRDGQVQPAVPGQDISAQDPAPEDTPATTRYDIPTEGYPSLGPKDAKIVLVEFSDFGCGYCAKWHHETYAKLISAYPDKIRFVYRHVPFRAFPAAEAAMCANEQNAFWPYHDKLFSYEYDLNEEDSLIQYAEDLNLDVESFSTCLSEHRYQEIVQEDMDYATQLGVSGTPTFFINGLALVGAQPLEVFTQLIDKELAGEIPK